MSRLFKNNPTKPHLSKANNARITIGGDCEQFPTFSFRYLTTNSKFNFGYFRPAQARDMREAKYNLYDRIEEICRKDWRYWGSLNKRSGFETLDYSRLKFSPTELEISKDEKVFIFRFNIHDNDARIIGIRVGKCPIFHVIGYDLDHSAYDHGS